MKKSKKKNSGKMVFYVRTPYVNMPYVLNRTGANANWQFSFPGDERHMSKSI